MKVLFVCHGNICRSAAAYFIFNNLLKDEDIETDSFATSYEEIGNDLYPPMKDVLLAHGIKLSRHHAKRITTSDYDNADLVLVMDKNNMFNLKRIVNVDSRVHLLGEYGLNGKEIEDPWYTDRYEKVYEEISICCIKLLEYLRSNKLC